MASAPEKKKTFTLKSMDGKEFVLDEDVAMQSGTIKNIAEAECESGGMIPVPNVDSETLVHVIEYCKNHADPATSQDDLKKFDQEFCNKELRILQDLTLAANYLEIKGLLDATCQKIADMIKDDTPEQVREKFNIINDFTPEEEAAIRAEHAWAFKQ